MLAKKPTLARAALDATTRARDALDEIAPARRRLEKAAVAIGSMLLDEVDPGWDEQQEIEAACVAYAKALRAANAETKES